MTVSNTYLTHFVQLVKQWKDGDAIPLSWKDYYRSNPCVPVDYSTVGSVFNFMSRRYLAHNDTNVNPIVPEQRRDVRILLRPGKHYLREAITIHSTKRVVMETQELPTHALPKKEEELVQDISCLVPVRRRGLMKRAGSVRKSLMSCRSVVSSIEETPEEDGFDETIQPHPSRAMLVLQTRRQNEPVIRVRQGILKLTDITIVHNANGIDIWNGNAAIQIQPPIGPDDSPVRANPRPTAILNRVEVVSKSGRGIVNIDGGLTEIRQCYIHDCAATGIYVGGPGSQAVIEQTDVCRNGIGNRNRRGIARGHSGIYLEQGTAMIRDCNISENSLTGLSAISQENAVLNLEHSDLVANGTVQLEMPPDGSTSHRRSLTRDNQVAAAGISRQRSGLIGED